MKKIKYLQLILVLLGLLAVAACDSDDDNGPADPGPGTGDLVINEFMASNDSWDVDGTGEYPDWIEIYNPGTADIDIGGWKMTDTVADDVADWFQIPTGSNETVVPAGGFLVLFANKSPEDGPLYLDFKLGSDGETIGLADGDDQIVDSLTFEQQTTDVSMGLTPDGTGTMVFLATPTPGAANSGAGGNMPPVVTSISFDPSIPRAQDDITVTVNAYDDSGIEGVYLYYAIGEGDFTYQEMTEVVKASGTYTWSSIPGQDAGTEIRYYIQVTDSDWVNTYEPEGAPEDYHSLTVATGVTPGLIINEFMASNDSWDVDGTGDYPDWIEIYNGSDAAIDLAGWYLTDDPTQDLTDWSLIPSGSADTVVPAGGWKVLFANNSPEDGALYLNFKLSGNGEQIALANTAGETICSFSYGEMEADASAGLYPDGVPGEMMPMTVPTPGAANSEPPTK